MNNKDKFNLLSLRSDLLSKSNLLRYIETSFNEVFVDYDQAYSLLFPYEENIISVSQDIQNLSNDLDSILNTLSVPFNNDYSEYEEILNNKNEVLNMINDKLSHLTTFTCKVDKLQNINNTIAYKLQRPKQVSFTSTDLNSKLEKILNKFKFNNCLIWFDYQSTYLINEKSIGSFIQNHKLIEIPKSSIINIKESNIKENNELLIISPFKITLTVPKLILFNSIKSFIKLIMRVLSKEQFIKKRVKFINNLDSNYSLISTFVKVIDNNNDDLISLISVKDILNKLGLRLKRKINTIFRRFCKNSTLEASIRLSIYDEYLIN